MTFLLKMSEKGEFTKFEAGFTKSEKKKNKYKIQLKRHIDEKELFVAPVQPTIKGQYRSAAYQIIHPIYKSSMLTETLANCFVCSKCDHIFLHLPRNGTGPFTSHKCYKEYDTALKKAQVEAAQAKQAAAEASNKAKMAKRSVGKLHKSSETSDSSSDDDSHGSQLNSNSMRLAPVHTQAGRPPYAEVLANAIEKFVKMALNGKAVKASDIIDEIPSDFSSVSWLVLLYLFYPFFATNLLVLMVHSSRQKFVETMEQNAPYRTKKVKVAIDRMKPDKMK